MLKWAFFLFIFGSSLFSYDLKYELAQDFMKKKDYEKAYNLFLEDANNGNPKSQVMIGRFFLQGNKLVDKDYTKAFYYFEKASKQKYTKADCFLAYMYANGMGTLANFGRAAIFAKKEKEAGNKLCIKVWSDFNLHKYPKDNSWKFGYYKPIE